MNRVWLLPVGVLCICWMMNSNPCAAFAGPQDLDAVPPVGTKVARLGDNLMTVFQDSKLNVWFATWGQGVYRTDGNTIVHFTTKDGLSHDRVEDIVEDKAGNLYFNTGAGVDKFDGQKFTRLPVMRNSAWQLADDDLWFKSLQFDGTLLRYDGRLLHALELPKVELGEKNRAENPNAANPYAVYTIYRDRDKNIWFGTAALGACRFDGRGFVWISSPDVNELHNGPANGVRSILQDDQGAFWFTTMYRYQIAERDAPQADREGPFLRMPGIGSLDGDPEGNFHEYMSIVQDAHGGIWIATYGGGVFHYDGQQLKNYLIRDGKKIVTLFSVYQDRQGKIWVGTHENGAYFFDGTAFVPFAPKSLSQKGQPPFEIGSEVSVMVLAR